MTDTANLATVVRVAGLQPIIGRDKIELAIIKGWKCVVKKGDFHEGELAIYFAIGCVPDFEDPNFSFLLPKYNRIKTIKMCGAISQGLLAPLHWLANRGFGDCDALREGDDVSKQMGVTKYIPPEEELQYSTGSGSGSTGSPGLRAFPEDIPKTDATRLQHHPTHFFSAIEDRDVVVTRKEDGCSCTFMVRDGHFQLCGRNYVFCDFGPAYSHYFEMEAKYDIKRKLLALGRNLALQGEIIGPKVNGNRLKLQERVFTVFDVFDVDRQEYLHFEELGNLCAQLGLGTVPLLYRGPASGLELTVDALLAFADRTEYAPGVAAEGIVVKLDDPEMRTRVTFKVIANKYLMKHDL